MELVGRAFFYDDIGNTKFPFYWTNNPWRYKGIQKDMLSVEERQIVGILEKFSHKLPTKGLDSVYLSTHPLIGLEHILVYLVVFYMRVVIILLF